MRHAAPRPGREADPHWQAAREGRLALPFCPSCESYAWPPRMTCARGCGAMTWRDCAGTGRVHSFSVVHRAVNPEMADAVPYVVAFVALDEGPRLMTNLVDCDPAAVRCGQRVTARFEASADPDLWVPVFVPIEEPA